MRRTVWSLSLTFFKPNQYRPGFSGLPQNMSKCSALHHYSNKDARCVVLPLCTATSQDVTQVQLFSFNSRVCIIKNSINSLEIIDILFAQYLDKNTSAWRWQQILPFLPWVALSCLQLQLVSAFLWIHFRICQLKSCFVGLRPRIRLGHRRISCLLTFVLGRFRFALWDADQFEQTVGLNTSPFIPLLRSTINTSGPFPVATMLPPQCLMMWFALAHRLLLAFSFHHSGTNKPLFYLVIEMT